MNAAATCTATTGKNSAGCSTLAVKCTINAGSECDLTKCMTDPAYKCYDAALILNLTGGELTFTGTGPANIAEASVTCGADAVWVDSRGIRGNTLVASIAPQSCLPCQTCTPFTDPMSEKATCTSTTGMNSAGCSTLAVKCMINAGFECNDVLLILETTGGTLATSGTGPGQIAETSVTCGSDVIWQDPNGVRGNTLIASIAPQNCLPCQTCTPFSDPMSAQATCTATTGQTSASCSTLAVKCTINAGFECDVAKCMADPAYKCYDAVLILETPNDLLTSGTGPGPIAETSITCRDDVVWQDPNGIRGDMLTASIAPQTCLPCQTCDPFVDHRGPEVTCTSTISMNAAQCATLAVKCTKNTGFECNDVILLLETTDDVTFVSTGTGTGQTVETSLTCGSDVFWQDADGNRGNTPLVSVGNSNCP